MSTEDHPAEEAPRRRWALARWRIAIAAAVGVLLLLGVVVWPFYRSGSKAEFDAMLERLRAAGEPMELADLFGPGPTDDENAAVLLREAGAWLETNDVDVDTLTTRHHNWAELATDDREALLAELVALEPCFELVRRALERPRLRFHEAGEHAPSLGDMVEIPLVQRLVKLLSARARRSPSEAARLESVRLMLAFTGRWEDTDNLMRGMVSAALARSAIRILREGIEEGRIDAATALTQLRPLLSTDWLGRHDRALRGERLQALRLHGLLLGEVPGKLADPDLRTASNALKGTAWLRHGMRQDGVRFCDSVQKFLESPASPPERHAILRELDALPPKKNTFDKYIRAGSAFVWTPAVVLVGRVHRMSVGLLASSRLALTALMIAEEHRRTGRWPTSLDEVSALLPPGTCVDPFTGKAFVLESLDDGVRLSSAGPADPDLWRRGSMSDPKELREAGLVWELRD